MGGRVTVRLTHAQARALVLLAHVHADTCGVPRDAGVYERAGDAIEEALMAQESRRLARAEVREMYPGGRPPDDPMLRWDDTRARNVRDVEAP